MTTLIKAAEAWLPNQDGTQLTLGSACYGTLGDFESISRSMTFSYGEGLPGRVWKARRPMIWNDLTNDQFKRRNFLTDTGIECGVGVPIFSGNYLLGVVVLFCGKSVISGSSAGAIEIWNNQTDQPENELKLESGYYGDDLEKFEWVSRKLSIMKGFGLPGTAWQTQKPHLIPDLGTSSSFLRAQNAADCGITTGLALPMGMGGNHINILTLLSADKFPIAHQFEIWQPDSETGKLVFVDGYLDTLEAEGLKDYFKDHEYDLGQGPLGEVWLTGRPKVVYQPGNATLIMPVILGTESVSIIRFTL